MYVYTIPKWLVYGIVLPTIAYFHLFSEPMCYSGSKVDREKQPGLLAEAGTFALWLRSGLPCSAGATHWSNCARSESLG